MFRATCGSPSHSLCEHCLVELGAFHLKTYVDRPKSSLNPFGYSEFSQPDGMERARYYQSLLDSGNVSTRAELARFLDVSRDRVTQVLRRLRIGNGK